MSDTPEVKALENDAKATVDAAVTVAAPIVDAAKKTVENKYHHFLTKMVLAIEAEAKVLGVDIEVEVAAIIAKIKAKI